MLGAPMVPSTIYDIGNFNKALSELNITNIEFKEILMKVQQYFDRDTEEKTV